MHGGSMEGGVVTSRSGSASYSFGLKLINPESAENVNLAAYQFFKTNTAIIDLGKKDKENVVAPYSVEFYSNIFKKSAYGNAKISVRFNTMADFRRIDEKIRSIVSTTKKYKGITQIQFDGGLLRPPMQEDDLNISLFNKVKEISRRIDTLVVAQHRWSSSDICAIVQRIPKIDGMGPLGGFDKNKSEYILRHSIVDRALLLALLMEK
jgi:D-alanine-D-alanine ligase